jgi:hypothetical protein
MNIGSKKIKPQPVSQNCEPSGPLPKKAILNPMLFDLMGNVKEKKVEKSGKMRIAD